MISDRRWLRWALAVGLVLLVGGVFVTPDWRAR